jgi:hypothetical protein
VIWSEAIGDCLRELALAGIDGIIDGGKCCLIEFYLFLAMDLQILHAVIIVV